MTSPTSMSPVVTPAVSYRLVRTGVRMVLGVVAVLLLGIAVYYAWNARALGTVGGEIPGTWGQAFKMSIVWPVLTWSALFGIAAAAGVVLLSQPRDDQPRQLATLLSFVLFGLAGAMACIPIYLLARLGFQLAITPVFLWAAMLFFAFVIGGLFMLMPTTLAPVPFRLTSMAIGGFVGLATVLLGFVLPLTIYRATFGGGLDAWRADWPAIFWPSVAIFGALVLMFLSLQLGRGLERQNQNVRRLIYGYNAVMTGMLLLAVLAIVNVLAYAEPFTRFFGRSFDWTASNMNALSPATRNLLSDLKEPVKVYTFLSRGDLLDADMQTLLDNCRSLSRKFSWEPVARTPENRNRLISMMEKYSISDPSGMLVLVGSEAEGSQPAYTFVKATDLARVPSQDPRQPNARLNEYSFIGENALLGAIQSLLEGKMTIYFTQGHREWSTEGAAAPPMMQRRPPGAEGKLSKLKSKLTSRRGVEVKTISLDRSTKTIPNDASVVVIARPTVEFTREEVTVLRDYLRRNRQTKKVKDKSGKDIEEETVSAGRLLLLLEPNIQREGDSSKLVRTGLEPLLAEYNVKLGENRILSLSRNPVDSYYEPMPDSTNAIARAFESIDRPRRFILSNAQTVDPLAEQGGAKLVEKILVTPERFPVWAETNFNTDPFVLVQALSRDRKKLLDTLSRQPLCVAVAVSDQGASAVPKDAAHAGLGGGKDTPRMVVFGTASWVSNESLSGEGSLSQMDLFSSTVSWLREKTAVGEGASASTAEGKERKLYSLGLMDEQRTRVTFLPLALVLLSIIGLGTGVWVVRRR